MDRKEICSKLNEIFKDIFDDESIMIKEATTQNDIEDWDSLGQINLIAAIEKEFKVHFRLDQMIDLKNVGQIIDIIISSNCK